ncbi:hypothetical protein [Streptomyces sp. NBC_00984]|uniref:hypothetical protein n=1 Tax=Streptomyces sp. NBC_00984 TaxID=2903700 RepID=UPI0038639B98
MPHRRVEVDATPCSVDQELFLQEDKLARRAIPIAQARSLDGTGHWKLHITRYGIWLDPQPQPSCPHCHGRGGWWAGGANPEMEACGCCADRRELHIRLPPVPARDEPPF